MMTGGEGWITSRRRASWLGLYVALLCLPTSAQTGPLAAARAQARAPIASPTVKADGDGGLSGEVPLDTRNIADPTDATLPGSPVPASHAGARIRANTPISIRLTEPVSSGAQRNGDSIAGVLLEPVKASNGWVLQAGTPVRATVLAAAKAGQLQSAGVLSLQVYQVGRLPVTSNVLEFSGQEGRREVADANPEKGTEAVVQPGSELNFEVLGSGDQEDPMTQAVGSGDAVHASGTSIRSDRGTSPVAHTRGAAQVATPR